MKFKISIVAVLAVLGAFTWETYRIMKSETPTSLSEKKDAARVANPVQEPKPAINPPTNSAQNVPPTPPKVASTPVHPNPIQPQHPVAQTVIAPQPIGACKMITFHHKKISTHASDDECSHHRNLIKLGHDDVNLATVCIRVNNIPVRHELVSGKKDEFVIGPVAGPRDTITARFCLGKTQCNEACKYPAKDPVKHDEFLDAIGGTDSDEGTQVAHWEAGDAAKTAEVNQAVDGEIKKELQSQDEASKKVAQSKMEVFKDWISESETPSCGSVAASR
jgi:hypothetical protein